MERHDVFAQELMAQYPQETSGFTVEEVKAIWERVSADFAAGWLDPDLVDGLVAQEFLDARQRSEHGQQI